jgi:RNA polymerase sigma-70 factor (ECF subfamily)
MGTPAEAARGELDELTLARAKRGEPSAERALVERYQRRVFALLGRMLGPSGRAADVEDVAQETFLRAFRALPRFDRRGRARLSTWILTIATRLALDTLKRRGPGLVPLEPVELRVASGDRTDSGLVRGELRAAVARAVAALAPEYRAAFVLRELHDFSYEEVAEALAIDLGTVKSRLSRARAALRAALSEVHEP